MNKLLIILMALFTFTTRNVTAQTTNTNSDVLDSISMSNVLKSVTDRSSTALDSKDEDQCAVVIGMIQNFSDQISHGKTPLSVEKKKEVSDTLVRLDNILGRIEDKLRIIPEKKDVRDEEFKLITDMLKDTTNLDNKLKKMIESFDN